MQAELEPIRTRRKEWEQRLPEVVEILKEGSAVAEKTAAATLADYKCRGAGQRASSTKRMFHLFHELRHASQYLEPELI